MLTDLGNDPRGLVELVRDTRSGGSTLEEYARGHGELEAAFPNLESDVESALLERDFRDAGDVENSLQFVNSHTTPRGNATSERVEGADRIVNRSLPTCINFKHSNKCESRFIPVVFDGMLDRNTPIPTYRISLPAERAA